MPDRPSSKLIPFYRRVLGELEAANVPALIGGAFALSYYAGIQRDTKDLDLFLRPEDSGRALAIGKAAGYVTSVEAPHWLSKIHDGDDVVDILYGSGNGLAVVDDVWFEHAVEVRLDDRVVKLIPAEEMIWSKGFIMERHRYDGADIAHVLHSRGPQLDWHRLLDRFDSHWPVLFSHLMLFLYIYPHNPLAVPGWVLGELMARLEAGAASPKDERECRGTFLSNFEYESDLGTGHFRDARLRPTGPLSTEELDIWKRHLGA